MFNKITDLINEQVMRTVNGMSEIPEEKKSIAVDTTTNSLKESFQEFATPEKISILKAMLSGEASTQSNNLMGGMGKNIVSALTAKVGLNPGASQQLASTVIPLVMSLFRKKTNDKESGFDIGTFLGALTGKSTENSSKESLMDKIGDMFKHKV